MKENIVEFPDKNALREEAAVWLIILDGDAEPSPQTLASLHEWLARGPAHRRELQDLALTWRHMNVLTELSVPLGRIDTPPSAAHPRQAHHAWLRPWALLTTLLLGFMLYGATLYWPRAREFDSNGTYTTRVGEQRTLLLTDNSTV
ncbi:MAG: DUF4880 domain-containing protein, partial [Pseudomonadales bacterium]|nr:DUF4880 domain-containing protein [Pseudomonadales bacterium]